MLLNQKKSQFKWTPVDYIERRSNLSYYDFINEYASIQKPVIITDIMQDWEALNKWNLDLFKCNYKEVEYYVKNDKNEIQGSMTIADYIDYMNSKDRDQELYLANWVISYYPELLEDYKEPIYFPNWLNRLPIKLLQKHEYSNPEVFIGYKNTSVGLHQDPAYFSAWLGLILGRKQIIFFTPDQADYLYGGKVDIFNPDLETFPLFAKAKSVEVILERGEVIYIPPKWWHYVKNLENSIGIGNLFINEWNSEMIFQYLIETYPIQGHLVRLILQYPWLGKFIFNIGVI